MELAACTKFIDRCPASATRKMRPMNRHVRVYDNEDTVSDSPVKNIISWHGYDGKYYQEFNSEATMWLTGCAPLMRLT
jgi:hypothetical protein